MGCKEKPPRGQATTTLVHSNRFGVIFDLDGTLADTLEDITATLNIVLISSGRPALKPPDVRPMIGMGLANLLGCALAVNDQVAPEALVEQYRIEYKRIMLERTNLFPGIDAVLNMLQEESVPMCVLSNKPTEFTRPICDALLTDWTFVRCTGPVKGMPRKPNPALALQLASRMKRRPADVYFVGDSPVDIETARNAEMTSIAVTWGYRERDQLQQADPNYLVDNAEALMLLLREAIVR